LEIVARAGAIGTVTIMNPASWIFPGRVFHKPQSPSMDLADAEFNETRASSSA